MTHRRLGLALAASILISAPAFAADAESCKTIRMSDPGWTDITSTNAIATVILEGLGYATDIQTLSVLVGYQSMKNKDIDVFLGNWMPAQQKFIDELNADKAAEVVAKNLERRQVHAGRADLCRREGRQGLQGSRRSTPTPSTPRSTASSPARRPTRTCRR